MEGKITIAVMFLMRKMIGSVSTAKPPHVSAFSDKATIAVQMNGSMEE